MDLKRRIWQGVLVALYCWPFAHYSLVQSYGLSPWKLHGMAMYCEPKLRESATLYELMGRRKRRLPQPAPQLETAINGYLRARQALGALASMQQVEHVALAHMGDRDGLLLEIESWHIDRTSRRMRANSSRELIINERLPGQDALRARLQHYFMQD